MRTLGQLRLRGKRVLLRLDLNVPLDAKGRITSDARIRQALPTIREILKRGASQLIIASHLGRPAGKRVPGLKLDPVARRLAKLLGRKIVKLDDCVDVALPDPKKAKIVLLENLRFHPGEEANDVAFAKKLAALANVYVNDAFGVCHRSAASVVAITAFLPSAAGPLIARETAALDLSRAKKPIVVLLGGAKVSDKLGLISALLEKTDLLLIGGAMAFTFFKAQGYEIGKSKYEPTVVELAGQLLKKAGSKLILPHDVLVVKKIMPGAALRNVPADRISATDIGVDIGQETVESYKAIIARAATIFWNGPLGITELKAFSSGTETLARAIAGLTKQGVRTIVGGGDTLAVVERLRLGRSFSHLSTGGGAALEFIEKGTLPGLKALS